MKRLLGLIGLTCLCVLTACLYLNQSVMLISCLVAFLLFALSLFVPSVRKEGTLPVAFITVVLTVLLFMGYTYFHVKPIQKTYEGKTCVVTAVQRNESYKSNRYYCYELDVKSIDGKTVNTGMILYTQEHIYSEAYDEISFTAELSENSYKSDMSKGLYLRSYLLFDENQVKVTEPERKPLMYHIVNLRKELRNSLYMELPADTADFASAVFLGDKHSLDYQVKNLLRICGLTHISVVSGLHLSILASVAMKMFHYIFRNKYVTSIFTIITIIGYTLLTGCGIPVVRSAVMLIIFTIGNMISRRSDSLNSIGAAALLILLHNPYAVGDIGMLLSFSATIGIVSWNEKLTSPVMKRLDSLTIMKFRPVKWIAKTIVYTTVCSVCATVWTLPIAILAFGGFSAVSVISNLLIVPFLTVVIVGVILCALTHYIEFLPLISQMFAFVVNIYYDYLISVCTLLSKIPYAYIHTDKPYFYFWLAATLILIAVALLIGSKQGYRIAIVASVMMLVFSSAAYNISRESIVTVHIPDTGSALSVVLESCDGHAVITCGGSKWKTFGLCNVVEDIDAGDSNVLVCASQDNSLQYAENLINEFDYDSVLLYDNKDEYTGLCVDSQTTDFSVFRTDHSLNLWDKVKAQLLIRNDLVYEYITAGDTQILILPEDADCAYLEEKYRNPDIIITHGVVDNMALLSCETLIVPGEDYIARATAEIAAPIANKVITGTGIIYDIKVK